VPLGKADPLLQVGDALAGRDDCLVILDNFEQVLVHAEATLGRWLDRAANARFLVTSREVLGIPGEEVLPLDSLDPKDAAELFRRRAAAVQRARRIDEADEQAIVPLVRLLDGMPLAIELAAARVSVMSPSALFSRMHERFSLLVSKGARRDRQATLRGTLDWSWELLKPSERSALAQLSVFEGSFNLEAAEAVIDLSDSGGASAALDTFQSLVDKSLTRARSDQRFDLLVSVRDYAAEQLRTEGRYPGGGPLALLAAKRRHVAHYASIGEAAAVLNTCADLGNLIVACREAAADGDVSSAVRALEAAWAALRLRGPFRLGIELSDMVHCMPGMTPEWAARLEVVKGRALRNAGRVREAAACLESALVVARRGSDARIQMRILSQLGELHVTSGRRDEGRAELTAALALAPACHDRGTECEVLCGMGNLYESLGELELARTYYKAALRLARAIGDRRWEGGSLGNLGTLCANQGKLLEADAYYQSGLRIARELGDRQWEGNTLCNLGLLHQSEGRLTEARSTLEAALALSREIGHVRLGAVVMCNLGIVHEALNAPDEARRQYDAACAVARELGDRRSEGQFLNYLGALNAREGRFSEATTCLDAAERLLEEVADRLSIGVLLCNRAEVSRLSGDSALALAILQQAEALARELCAEPDSELGRSIARVKQTLAASA
jgi:predicted ATPase